MSYGQQPYRDDPFTDGQPAEPHFVNNDYPVSYPSQTSLHANDDGYQPRSNIPAPMPLTPFGRPAQYDAVDGQEDVAQHQSGVNSYLAEQDRKKKRSKYIAIGAIVLLLVLIGVGVGVGVSVAKSHSGNSDLSGKNDNGNGNGNGGSNPVGTNPNDPSNFSKDPRLHQSFYGIAYTPAGSQLPECGNSLSDIIEDIQLLSQLTTRVRLYGADCNQTALVLEAVKQTKVNMTIYIANYPIPGNNTPYEQQKTFLEDAITTYGTDHIGGVTVGNEFMLNYLDDNGGGDDPNSAIGNTGAQILIADMNDTRAGLAAMNLDKTLPVGTSDAGSYFNTLVMKDMAYGMANVHPWFGNVAIEDAATWTWDFFEETNVKAAALLPNNPTMYIAETGWPTNSSTVAAESDGPSNASVANLQIFLDTFVCQANANGTKYFFFEFFDEEWKNIEFGGVEGYWGLFTANKTLKSVNVPNCTIS